MRRIHLASSVQAQKGVLQAEATEPVRTLVENIPRSGDAGDFRYG